MRWVLLVVLLLVMAINSAPQRGKGHGKPPKPSPSPTATPTPTPTPIQGDGWLTYNHDARRSGATSASIAVPLTQQWRYRPAGLYGLFANSVQHVLATNDTIYLRWSFSASNEAT